MANELVKMTDVLRHLGLPQGDTTNQAELQLMIDAATPIVEYITGPINPVTYTGETHNVDGASTLMLRHPPVQSIATITEWVGITPFVLTSQPPGSTVSNYGYNLERPEAGKVVRMSAFGQPTTFLGSLVTVTYTAGLPVVNGVVQIPPDVRLGVLEDIRGIFTQSQDGGRPKWGGGLQDEDGWTVGPLHLFPRLAALLENKARVQSIA